jgi:SAM-dependent methyltransferase
MPDLSADELARLAAAPELAQLRALLERADLRLRSLAARLGLDRPESLLTQVSSYALLVGRKLAVSDDAGLLWSALLWFGRSIERAHANRVLGPDDLALLERLSLLHSEGSRVESKVALTEWDGLWFLSDRIFHFDPSAAAPRLNARPDAVMPIHYSSLALWAASQSRPGEGARARRLDIGCGAGFPLLAARDEERVGLDLNPRAIAFARANALLDGTSATWICADCLRYRPDAPFDHVTFNLPTVPAYHPGAELRAGPPDLLPRMLAERLPLLLAPGGLLQLWTVFSLTREHDSPETWLAAALPDGWRATVRAEPGSPFSLTAAAVAGRSVPRQSLLLDHPDDAEKLLEHLRQRGIVEVVSAVADVRRS